MMAYDEVLTMIVGWLKEHLARRERGLNRPLEPDFIKAFAQRFFGTFSS
jgi:hypothetical protein